MKKLILALACTFLVAPCPARIITVDDDGPADFNNIQAAINDANDEDIIEVNTGTYTGDGNRDIDFLGKVITVRSTDPNNPNIVADTIINCNGTEENPHRGFHFHSSEDVNSVLNGVTIINGYVTYDLGSTGGAIYCENGSSPKIINCIITGNEATSWPKIGGGSGGAVSGCNGEISNCLISENSAMFTGGLSGCDGIIRNNIITNNIAGYLGGGLGGCDGIIHGNVISQNHAQGHGGGLAYCSAYIHHNIIAYNTALGVGGGLHNCSGEIENNTICNNSTLNGGGGINECTATVSNCIVWENMPDQVRQTSAVRYSDVQGGWPGLGNIDVDPCFADPDANDFHLQSQAGRWDPDANQWVIDANTSLCIDAGNPGCPPANEPAPNGNRINMGAYGGTAEAGKSPANWALLADLTNDHKVDFNDLRVFVNYWLESGQCIPGDLNRSRSVNLLDYGIFALQWLKNNYISLEVYSDGWGNLLETATMKEEGQITIPVYEEDPYGYPPARYYVYASRDGYYTEIYNCEAFGSPPNNFITVDVDLDPIMPGMANGVIFMTQPFFSDFYLSLTDVNVVDINTLAVVTQFQTDEQGRFAIDLEPGNYYFEFTFEYEAYSEEVEIQGQYQDFFFLAPIVVYKPNIYLYPEESIELDVNVVFPHGGQITTAIPDYNGGWHITVEPSGIIDGQYECLFYESLQPDYGQYDAGWVVATEELESFLRNNMTQTGFNEKEIDDFIEYWIPLLTDYPYYAIYPQYTDQLDAMIQLEFSTPPQSLIRLIYSVRGLTDDNLTLPQPVIPPLAREGFAVTEWGVILK